MDKLYVKNCKKLSGSVDISCAKNSYLAIMAGVLLTDEKITLHKLPNLRDIKTMNKLLQEVGVKISNQGKSFDYVSNDINNLVAPYELVKTMRASILLLGPLLTRFNKVKVSLPGGCAIGQRPIDIHLDALIKMGAKIEIDKGYVIAETDGLIGTHITFPFPSVGATENLLMAAVLAKGETILDNVALEPEIEDLCKFLNTLGAKITGVGTKTLTIKGVSKLNGGEYQAIGDRIEAGTFIIAALMTKSEITINDINPSHLDSFIEILKTAGANILCSDNSIKVLISKLKPFVIDTAPFPGFPTDLQAQMTSLATIIDGTSIVSEHIFENRFMHIPELVRMGASIQLKSNSAIITGSDLNSAPVMCTDLRASAALILAALVTPGETEIRRVYHLDRGYENIEGKLTKLGVEIKRVNE